MKLLIVEDNPELSQNIKSYLSKEGYVCEQVETLRQASEKLYAYAYDVMVLDLMLPDGEGLTLLRDVKGKWVDMGVLIISARNSLDDRLSGLDLGADDYLSKPFHLAELNARIKAIYRRRNQKGENKIEFNEIVVELDSHECTVIGVTLDLTRKEFELIYYFLVNQGRLLTKQAIAEHLWGDYMDGADSFDFVYQHIKNLRKKITEAGGKDYIQTVYGTGYKFKEE